jgi:hypothetical protein
VGFCEHGGETLFRRHGVSCSVKCEHLKAELIPAGTEINISFF